MTLPLPDRDHGGGLDAAISRYGGTRRDWLDLSTGINPVPYPVGHLPFDAWTTLPDAAAAKALDAAARAFWNVPEELDLLAAPGASCLIAQMPRLLRPGRVHIESPTYNEHAAAFTGHGWQVTDHAATARVVVHPNNPTGTFWDGTSDAKLLVIDESFCDIAPERSHVPAAMKDGTVVLKSFGKFWGLAGLRLGFAIARPGLIQKLRDWLGPWPVSGAALAVGATALNDHAWAERTRQRLAKDAEHLDSLMGHTGATVCGGTPLFRLYDVGDAAKWQDRLARHRIWSRVFPYSRQWLRLGLPAPDHWARLETALGGQDGTAGGAMPKASDDPASR